MSDGPPPYPRPLPLALPRPSGRQLRRRALQTFRVGGRNFRRLAGRRLFRRPIAEHAYARALSLPLFPSMSESDVDDVIAAVKKVAAAFRR